MQPNVLTAKHSMKQSIISNPLGCFNLNKLHFHRKLHLDTRPKKKEVDKASALTSNNEISKEGCEVLDVTYVPCKTEVVQEILLPCG